MIGDGTDLFIIMGGMENQIIQLVNPLIREITQSFTRNTMETISFGGSKLPHLELSNCHETEISMLSNEVVVFPDSKDMRIQDILLQKYSITELLKVINTKIKRRDEKFR